MTRWPLPHEKIRHRTFGPEHLDDAARVAFNAIREELPRLCSVKHIRFVLHDERSRQVHQRVLEER
jgi:O-acetyl-ADP-ribose deacetylase (regulator of RNase III)